jgi:arylsulfatase A-like enzyme
VNRTNEHSYTLRRREFLQAAAAGAGVAASRLLAAGEAGPPAPRRPPNVVFVFADQWRAQATGYAGDPNARTPHLDALAARSVNFTTAVSGCPVCSPYRASLLTGQYPLTHGVFLNDVHLADDAPSIAKAFKAGGYETGYVGKWHVGGRGRLSFIPRAGRQGFDFWKVCECTHAYNQSVYYGDGPERLTWEGYDAEAQTRAAQEYLRGRGRDPARPFLLMLSWGPPHNPYETAPAAQREAYPPASLKLRPNVPPEAEKQARADLAGYYAHGSALDGYVGDLRATLREAGLEDNTLFVFTSDHGDMLGSQGQQRKQRPWDESILVPLLVHYPAALGREGRSVSAPLNAPDVMPTLLGLCGLPAPKGVEGIDFSGMLTGRGPSPAEAALVACYTPFGEWTRSAGGREYRGLRTERYTYVRERQRPWLLYDNQADPYQLRNLVDEPGRAALRAQLEETLARLLKAQRDEFLPGPEYIAKWGWTVDRTGTAPSGP